MLKCAGLVKKLTVCGIAIILVQIVRMVQNITRNNSPSNLAFVCKDFKDTYYGRTPVNPDVPEWKYLEHSTPNLQLGGHFKPKDCFTKHKVAVIVPIRNRTEHLKLFLQHMHPFLQRQNIEYTIYVVELVTGIMFNKGIIMNAGFLEVSKITDYNCFIFHDVDLIPMHTGLSYTCKENEFIHLSRSVRQYAFRLEDRMWIGGVLVFPKELYKSVNGHSNVYWGWGGEDNDIQIRLKERGINITGPSTNDLRYWSWEHERESELVNRAKIWKGTAARMNTDGLNSCKYEVLKVEKRPLYTWFYISANQTDHQVEGIKPVYMPNRKRIMPDV